MKLAPVTYLKLLLLYIDGSSIGDVGVLDLVGVPNFLEFRLHMHAELQMWRPKDFSVTFADYVRGKGIGVASIM